MTLNPQALEAARNKYLEHVQSNSNFIKEVKYDGILLDFHQCEGVEAAIQAYLAALPKVDEDYMCEKLRCAAADCDIRLEIDQQRYILKDILPLIRGE